MTSCTGRRVAFPAWRRLAVFIAVLIPAAPPEAAAQAVTPPALYFDQRTRSGTLTLTNTGDRELEIEVRFGFGYPQTDSVGTISVPIDSVAPPGQPSARGWIRAFPRQLRLAPGERQIVRVLIEPPAGLTDGEYWARVLVASRGGQPPIEQRQGNITVMTTIETVFAASLAYRHGNVSTGVDVARAGALVEDSTVVALLDLKRLGNAAYLGTVSAELLDSGGRQLSSASVPAAVYYDFTAALRLPYDPRVSLNGARIRYVVDARRSDLPANGPLPAPRVVGTIELPPAF